MVDENPCGILGFELVKLWQIVKREKVRRLEARIREEGKVLGTEVEIGAGDVEERNVWC